MTLDAEEYFHLALHASSVGDHHACMSYLVEVLQRQPANARALYLRAAQHAEVGLTERAVSGIKAALEIEPGLQIARFHLGLLLMLDRKRPQEARQYFLDVDGGDQDHALRAYAAGMVALADNDVAQAREKIAHGLAQTPNNQPLKVLMKRLLDQLPDGAQPGSAAADPERGHVLLGAYRQGSS